MTKRRLINTRNKSIVMKGSIFSEYILIVTLVTLTGGTAIASLGLHLLVNFRFAQGLLTIPFP